MCHATDMCVMYIGLVMNTYIGDIITNHTYDNVMCIAIYLYDT